MLIFFLAFFLDFFELSFIVVPLLAPVAEKLGIDLIWFGVLLGVNMQTSFMHPPFGFALFYLRSVAPAKEYTDRITRKLIQPVTTMQIYWGAVPFVLIQVVMVGLIIAFPGHRLQRAGQEGGVRHGQDPPADGGRHAQAGLLRRPGSQAMPCPRSRSREAPRCPSPRRLHRRNRTRNS